MDFFRKQGRNKILRIKEMEVSENNKVPDIILEDDNKDSMQIKHEIEIKDEFEINEMEIEESDLIKNGAVHPSLCVEKEKQNSTSDTNYMTGKGEEMKFGTDSLFIKEENLDPDVSENYNDQVNESDIESNGTNASNIPLKFQVNISAIETVSKENQVSKMFLLLNSVFILKIKFCQVLNIAYC